MDKTFAFLMNGFFVLCALFITWGMMDGKKKNSAMGLMAWCYTAFTWACVIALIVLTLIYKGI